MQMQSGSGQMMGGGGGAPGSRYPTSNGTSTTAPYYVGGASSSHQNPAAVAGGSAGYPTGDAHYPSGQSGIPHNPNHQQQMMGQHQQANVGPSSSGSRHMGGKSSGHRARSSMMHQHRASAAAISDPMLASGLTEQLANASGALTGSGSALNQLTAGYPTQGTSGQVMGATTAGYYNPNQQQQQMMGPGGGYIPRDQIHSQSGYPSAGGGQHQSRYDSYYDPSLGGGHGAPRSSRARSHTMGVMLPGMQQQQFGQMGQLGSTTAGAYHLDMSAREAGNLSLGATGGYPNPSSLMDAQQQQQYSQMHSRPGAYLGGQDPLLSSRMYLDRALSMPPSSQLGAGLSSSYGGAGNFGEGVAGGLGLGAYNPLDDPLASSNLAVGGLSARNPGLVPTLGPDPLLAGLGSSAVVPSHQRDAYVTELKARLMELQNSYANVKRELDSATQKLGSSMHSIKTFWSPELKKERALRKEEATKFALINDQMKLMRVEVQVS